MRSGQVLATLADTYGLSGNAVDEASLGVQGAQLSQENSLASLDQALENARIAYVKAQTDYDALKLPDVKDTTTSKAELDLQNFITSQDKQLEGYETTYQSQLQSFRALMVNVLDTSDTLLGVSPGYQNLNDNFEYVLGALDSGQKITAENALRALLPYQDWSPDTQLPLIQRVQELQRVYLLVSNVLAQTKTVLINSLTDSDFFTDADIAKYRATIDGYQTQYNTLSAGLVTFLNTTQSFLATYQTDRVAHEQAAKTNAENSLNALSLAKKAYDTAQKSRDIGGSQTDQSIDINTIHLQNAQGNAARLVITAPFSGVVIAQNVEIGSLASPGTNLFTLGDVSTLVIKTDIGVDRQKYLQIGQMIPLHDGDITLVGKLSSLSAGPDPQTHLYKAEITLPKIHPKVTLGDIVTVLLPGAPTRANDEEKIVIPFSALRNL